VTLPPGSTRVVGWAALNGARGHRHGRGQPLRRRRGRCSSPERDRRSRLLSSWSNRGHTTGTRSHRSAGPTAVGPWTGGRPPTPDRLVVPAIGRRRGLAGSGGRCQRVVRRLVAPRRRRARPARGRARSNRRTRTGHRSVWEWHPRTDLVDRRVRPDRSGRGAGASRFGRGPGSRRHRRPVGCCRRCSRPSTPRGSDR
jgi:hypothetical protein